MILENIQYLLAYHDCVILPDFGGIITNYQASSISLHSNQITPPFKNIAFNKALSQNDGLLIQQIAFTQNCSYKEAEKKVKAYIKDLNAQLEKSGSFILTGIGRLYKDENNQILFNPVQDKIVFAPSFGMPTLSLKPVARLKENIAATAATLVSVSNLEQLVDNYSDTNSNEIPTTKTKPMWTYWAAAATSIAFILASFWINKTIHTTSNIAKGSLFIQNTDKKPTTTTKPTTPKSTKTKTETKPSTYTHPVVEFKKEELDETTTTPKPKEEVKDVKPTDVAPKAQTPKPTTTPAPTSSSIPPKAITTTKPTTTPKPTTSPKPEQNKPAVKPTVTPKPKTGKVSLVAGSYGKEENAKLQQAALKAKGYNAKVVTNPDNGMFRVVIETTPENKAADLQKAKSDIAPSVWILEE